MMCHAMSCHAMAGIRHGNGMALALPRALAIALRRGASGDRAFVAGRPGEGEIGLPRAVAAAVVQHQILN